jgi:transcriptional regulator with XRE-family HTH domain
VQVAERMQVNRSFISRLENHPQNITLGTLNRYAKAVGMHCDIALHA